MRGQVLPRRRGGPTPRSSRSTPSASELAAREIAGGRAAFDHCPDGCTHDSACWLPLRGVSRGAAAGRRSSTAADTLEWMGRFMGRIHAARCTSMPYVHRARRWINRHSFGEEPRGLCAGARPVSCRPDLSRRLFRCRRSGAGGRASSAVSIVPVKVRRILAAARGLSRAETCCGSKARDGGPWFVDFDDSAAWGRRCRICGCCCPANVRISH
jgi:hypothetical protein